MPYAIREHPGMTLIGLTARTDNATESGGQGAIPATWDKLVQGNILNRIAASSAADRFYAAYVEYQSDASGPYTFLLGAEATGEDPTPMGLTRKSIPGGRFAVFVARTPVEVPTTWREIWGTPLRRRYLGDFEIYSRHDPTLPVEIFVGIE
jgi:predicted transcriptional regulator YdeE